MRELLDEAAQLEIPFVHPPIEWAVTPSNLVAHHNSAGTIDYWLVPRMQSGVPMMVKVVPIVQNISGTLVHHIAKSKTTPSRLRAIGSSHPNQPETESKELVDVVKQSILFQLSIRKLSLITR